MFAARVLPTPVFESYTPTELQLARATLLNPSWVQAQAAQGVRGTDLDTYFREYINQHFPLARADPAAFAQYVAAAHRQRAYAREMRFATQQQQLWWASHPHGQRFEAYPGPTFAGDEEPLDLDRFYAFPPTRPYFTPVPPPPPDERPPDLPREGYDRLW